MTNVHYLRLRIIEATFFGGGEDCDIEQAGNPFMIDEFPSLEWSWGMKVKSQLIFANAYIV